MVASEGPNSAEGKAEDEIHFPHQQPDLAFVPSRWTGGVFCVEALSFPASPRVPGHHLMPERREPIIAMQASLSELSW